jgi:hypothetical protein
VHDALQLTEWVLLGRQALEKYNIEKDIAAYIKKEFDKKYNPTWHCIVGRNFGASNTSVVWRAVEWVCARRRMNISMHLMTRPVVGPLRLRRVWLERRSTGTDFLHPMCVAATTRLVRHARDETLHLLLLGSGGGAAVQVGLSNGAPAPWP